VEDLVNDVIRQNLTIGTEVTDFDQAVAGGAMALSRRSTATRSGWCAWAISAGALRRHAYGRTGDIGFFKVISEGAWPPGCGASRP